MWTSWTVDGPWGLVHQRWLQDFEITKHLSPFSTWTIWTTTPPIDLEKLITKREIEKD
jgi:hypothetical protein